MDIMELEAVDLSTMMADGRISAVEVMTACLTQIDAGNGAVNAIVSLRDRDTLIAEARAADAAPRKGWLHGVPVAVKDLANVAGLPTTMGSPAFRNFTPKHDDLVVARMRDAGAIFIGKTNTPEFGLGSHTTNPVHGPTRNPYDTTRSAGGSSGGAAAALAMRMQWVCDGSDMMGSLRNPAGWNNVYGFRPSWGLVPGDPVGDVYLHKLATLGPMARSVRDIAALLDVQAGADPRLPFSHDGGPFTGALDADVKDWRIGWLGDWGGAYPMEQGVMQHCETALQTFTDMGCVVEHVAAPMPASDLWQSWVTLRAFANAARLEPLYNIPEKRALLPDQAIWEIEQGMALTAMDVQRASAIRSRWFAKAAELFHRYDALVLPTAQCWPFPVQWSHPETISGQAMDTYHRWMEVVVPASLTGLPALGVPAGFGPGGLPMGLQIIGGYRNDLHVLRLGHAWHQATGWPARNPPQT